MCWPAIGHKRLYVQHGSIYTTSLHESQFMTHHVCKVRSCVTAEEIKLSVEYNSYKGFAITSFQDPIENFIPELHS